MGCCQTHTNLNIESGPRPVDPQKTLIKPSSIYGLKLESKLVDNSTDSIKRSCSSYKLDSHAYPFDQIQQPYSDIFEKTCTTGQNSFKINPPPSNAVNSLALLSKGNQNAKMVHDETRGFEFESMLTKTSQVRYGPPTTVMKMPYQRPTFDPRVKLPSLISSPRKPPASSMPLSVKQPSKPSLTPAKERSFNDTVVQALSSNFQTQKSARQNTYAVEESEPREESRKTRHLHGKVKSFGTNTLLGRDRISMHKSQGHNPTSHSKKESNHQFQGKMNVLQMMTGQFQQQYPYQNQQNGGDMMERQSSFKTILTNEKSFKDMSYCNKTTHTDIQRSPMTRLDQSADNVTHKSESRYKHVVSLRTRKTSQIQPSEISIGSKIFDVNREQP